MKPKLQIKLGQPSWRLASDEVEAFVTQTGGHIGPVTFQIGGRKIQPYSVAPWAEEKLDAKLPSILKVLRGDFFCLPFDGNATPFRGERHPVYGKTANEKWMLESSAPSELHLSLKCFIVSPPRWFHNFSSSGKSCRKPKTAVWKTSNGHG